MPKEQSLRINGNLYFSSINSLSGYTVSCKDDIIALWYYLIDSYKWKLPWYYLSGDNKNKKKCKELKNKYTAKILCQDNLKEVSDIFGNSNE